VERLRFLLSEVTGDGATQTSPGQIYTVQEDEDVFGISEAFLGRVDYVPDLLKANPERFFAAGEEIVLPEVGNGATDSAASDAEALAELFETKGPPNDSWTAEDYALLERVRGQAMPPPPPRGSQGGSGPGSTQDEVLEEEESQESEERIPASAASFELPAEDAEVIEQFVAQMIMNGVVPDGSAWALKGGRNVLNVGRGITQRCRGGRWIWRRRLKQDQFRE
jgi:hypothetical protein